MTTRSRTRHGNGIGKDLRSSLQKGVITLADMSLVSAMMMSLNQMVGIRRLVIETRDANPLDIIPFIRKFAEQLTMLEIDFAISMIGADAFPHLTRLRCRLFDAASSAAFPKLAELIVYGLTRYELLPNMGLPMTARSPDLTWMSKSPAKALPILSRSL